MRRQDAGWQVEGQEDADGESKSKGKEESAANGSAAERRTSEHVFLQLHKRGACSGMCSIGVQAPHMRARASVRLRAHNSPHACT